MKNLVLVVCLSAASIVQADGILINIDNTTNNCNVNIKPSTPVSRYQLLTNGAEVKDLQTGLIWQRCSLGQTWSGTNCMGVAGVYTWLNALQTAKNMGSGWRLPNIRELKTMVENACYQPAVNMAIFGGVGDEVYWSSSPVFNNIDTVWTLTFVEGMARDKNKNENASIRLVRYE